MNFPKHYPTVSTNLQRICSVDCKDDIYTLRMTKNDNRINAKFVSALTEAIMDINEDQLTQKRAGKVPRALVTIGQDNVYSNGLDTVKSNSRNKLKFSFKKLSFLLVKIMTLPFPTIAALNGHTSSCGVIFAMAHDLRVMKSEGGFFYMNEVNKGIKLPQSLVFFLKEKTRDFQIFRDLVLLGTRYNAEEALSKGLVDYICPGDQVYDKACQLACLHGEKMINGSSIYMKMRSEYCLLGIKSMNDESVKPKPSNELY